MGMHRTLGLAHAEPHWLERFGASVLCPANYKEGESPMGQARMPARRAAAFLRAFPRPFACPIEAIWWDCATALRRRSICHMVSPITSVRCMSSRSIESMRSIVWCWAAMWLASSAREICSVVIMFPLGVQYRSTRFPVVVRYQSAASAAGRRHSHCERICFAWRVAQERLQDCSHVTPDF